MLNLRKKLLVSIFTLMLALVAVSTTTYAWFTMGADVSVSNIDLTVKGVEGLKVRVISVNGFDTRGVNGLGSHSTDIVFNEGYLSGVELVPMTLVGAHTTGTDAEGKDYDYTSLSTTSYSEKTLSYVDVDAYEDEASIAGNYLEIEFEFLGETESTTNLSVYISNISFEIPDDFSFSSDVKFNDGTNEIAVGDALNKVRLVNALRFAHSARENDTATDATADSYAGLADYKLIKTAKTTVASTVAADLGTWGKASVNYFKAVNNCELEVPGEYKEYYGFDTAVVELKPSKSYTGQVGRATLRIWLEGWDSDCFNAIIKDKVQIAISFSTTKPAA